MHVKVEELLIYVGEFTLKDEAVLEYHIGKTEEDLLSYFWFDFEESSRFETSEQFIDGHDSPRVPSDANSSPMAPIPGQWWSSKTFRKKSFKLIIEMFRWRILQIKEDIHFLGDRNTI